ncbi:adenylate cyclase [Duganella sp. LX47W]|uniref:Adenylate cyclase n=2 Tax=Rugamonas apoptosis TaxID=2758570 RepID=A0A7W2F8S5_9BURK|nr:adenylate cyclase [Rugamonas apoptosis]
MTPTITQAAPANTVRTAPALNTAPSHTGQPNQSCGSVTAPNTPGNAVAAPGSAFNPDGTAGSVYAGQQPQNSRNPVSVSQYDVACFHQPSR